ncbi:unnamed protein product [Paramecium sonneborni]|uniref:Protein kinase domain-containing protein n=1 Tax=Paramecium sonneborni TaxID=65129 RepID=A0A8S1Q5R1_9CILI|nr:unnamed protein product [Paramecium sonneborni]
MQISWIQNQMILLIYQDLNHHYTWMAPQILEKQSFSSKCDVWSVGIILYELLYQKPLGLLKTHNFCLKTSKINHSNFHLNLYDLKKSKNLLLICQRLKKKTDFLGKMSLMILLLEDNKLSKKI